MSEGKGTKSSGVPLHFKVTTNVKYVLCISKGRKKNFIFFTVTNGGNYLNFFIIKKGYMFDEIDIFSMQIEQCIHVLYNFYFYI